MKKTAIIPTMALALAAISTSALAAITEQEAAPLKNGTLMPLGGEKAGNADGTIPAWDGVYTKVPAGWQPGMRRGDVFPEDKPLFSITSANVDQYADKLNEGQVKFMKMHEDYRIDVYKTRRTAGGPQWIYDNTYDNALKASVINDGLTLKDAFGGIPFPIPKDGHEMMWNSIAKWQGTTQISHPSIVYVSGGNVVLAAYQDRIVQAPYYDMEHRAEYNGDIFQYRVVLNAPPLRAGEAVMILYPTDELNAGTRTWVYLTGQRRVRKLGVASYDTPLPNSAGLLNQDEALGFSGAQDRYEWKIIGKREMYIPYNSNKINEPKSYKDVVQETSINPDLVRWELHRVWELEANLLPGKRHTSPRRKFYLDEDTWNIGVVDMWDANGTLWKTEVCVSYLYPDLPGHILSQFSIYNMIKNEYVVAAIMNENDEQVRFIPTKPLSYFTPAALAGEGVR